MPATDQRETIQAVLRDFTARPLAEAARTFLDTLGYRSDRTLDLGDSSPGAFLDYVRSHVPNSRFDETKALFADWKSADLLFQLTDEELSSTSSLFHETDIQPGLLRSYLFFAIELTGDHYPRGRLTQIARQINRVFPMPVMVLIKHPADKKPVLSIAVINRRQNKREADKDVLGKVTIIRDISLADPHRGHLDILSTFAFENLVHPQRLPINNFDALHAAWEEIFNVELLNKRFYRELADWYFWAMRHAHFPLLDEKADRYFLFKDREKVREHEAKNLIRLLTRILFVWFIKEKNLVSEELFDPVLIRQKYLKDFEPESDKTVYYKAILQNLFFATLNQVQGKREFRKAGQHHNTTNLLRYESAFKAPQAFIDTVESLTPFLNGGLFECLDYPHPTKTGPRGGRVTVYEDGFSDREDNPLVIPDFLFFGREQSVDLSGEFGDPKRKKEKVRGLIDILNGYKFTILENTPIDQEIALDPELLGKVFENLLASYNEETKTTARKQTGSFYTPRTIVDYMVDESLKAHLCTALVNEAGMQESDAKAGLDILFAYTEREHAFTAKEVDVLIRAIDSCNILDPACGSGAFPMGVLQKLVYILGKLDPRDELWKRRQLEKVEATIRAAEQIDDTATREKTLEDLEAQKQDIEDAFEKNELGYGRKLYLIENCIYGVDIQSIATQVSKLRFFISLVVDQKVDRRHDNFGVRPLPNLETKFVAADTLIRIQRPSTQAELFELTAVNELQEELKRVRHNLFSAKTPRTKNKYRERDKELREAIAAELEQNGWESDTARKLAGWDPYDQNASASYFDPEWMFGQPGFDIVIGNPPYIDIKAIPVTATKHYFSAFKTAKNRINLYALFIEKGYSLVADHGVLSIINPNSLLVGESYSKLRALILDDLTAIVKLPDGIFEQAIVETMLLFVQRHSDKPTVKVATYGNREPIDFENVRYELFHKTDWNSNSETRFSIFSSAKENAICAKLEENKAVFDDEAEFCLGLTPYDKYKGHSRELIQSRAFHSDRKIGPDYVPLITGKNIKPFVISDTVSEWIKYGPWLGAPREKRFFTTERIIVRQIASGTPPRIFAGYTEKSLYHSQVGFAILARKDLKISLKVILALLNSRLLNFYHSMRYLDREKVTFQKVLIANVRKFPLPQPNKAIQQEVIRTVDEILVKKTSGLTDDTNSLERELDQHVYMLYDLTSEEITIVEDFYK